MGHRSGAPALGALLHLLQFMVPEQLRSTVVQQHVQGHVVRVSPPPRDRALLASQFGYLERIPHPNPPADLRIFGPQCFSLLLARHPWSQREQGSEPSLPSGNATANTRGYTDVMPQYLAKNTSGTVLFFQSIPRPPSPRQGFPESCHRRGGTHRSWSSRIAQRSSWMRIMLPAGSRKAQSRTP